MKKEISYLSLPDYYNKYLLININQKFNYKNIIGLRFKLSNNFHLGSAIKVLYLLEIIFPRKPIVFKIKLKTKKLYFGQKKNNLKFFIFDLKLYSFEFIEFFRFFTKNPFKLNKNKMDNYNITNRKLKQFEFNHNLYIELNCISSSFITFSFYHLN